MNRGLSKVVGVFVVFVIIWFAAVGYLYWDFKSSPVKEMDTYNGQVIGQKGFFEARAFPCSVMSIGWMVALTVSLVIATSWGSKSRAATPTGWHIDPMRRHQYRYWDGGSWTAHVSDDGAQSIDPLEGAQVGSGQASPRDEEEAEPAMSEDGFWE
jgi:hypothetical protein